MFEYFLSIMSSSQQIDESKAEQAMRESFEQQVEEILDSAEKYEAESTWKIGLETEYGLVDESLTPVNHETRDQLIEDLEFADVEVGGSQVELRTEPLEPGTLSELEDVLERNESELVKEASKQGLNLVRSGTNPFIDTDNIPISSEEKYQQVPSFYEEARHSQVHEIFGGKDSIDPRNSDLAALINSTQVNVQAEGLEDAVEKANLTYMISPFLSAISGNARFLEGKNLGFSDVRMPLWEKSHDIRNPDSLEEEMDVGKLDSYFLAESEDETNIENYFRRVKEQPFILNDEEKQEAAREIGIGTYWKDSRIKFNHGPEEDRFQAVVESRIVSTQPSIAEEIAMHGFYLGRLAYAQNIGDIEEDESDTEELMDIEQVNRNRHSAMYNGLDTKLYDTDGELRQAVEVMEEELEKAEKGLDYIDLNDSGYLDILYERLEEGTPSDQMAEEYYRTVESGTKSEESLNQALMEQVSISEG